MADQPGVVYTLEQAQPQEAEAVEQFVDSRQRCECRGQVCGNGMPSPSL
jgi:hypothetical protein